MTLAPGTRLGAYEVLAPLGTGGMGEVYRARDPKLDREVAIKVLPSDVSSNEDRRARFEREARAASALNHPNIVTIHDFGFAGPTFYMVMERVDGRTLRNILAAGPLPMKRIMEVGAQLADGLAKAHAADIVHRDLKPENVMVTMDGFVKILDFGLAKLLPPHEPQGLPEAPTGTRPGLATDAGVVLGTVGYRSPEQASGRSVDFRSDQFSLGAILYEMATGKRAFKARSRGHIASPEPQASIAVLPFQTFGGKVKDEYFSDGMTESIITDLAKAKGLLVIARNSVFQYKGKSVNVPRVGHELNVGYLLEGSVQRSAGRVRVNAQLIDVATGFHRWAERYDRDLKDVFDVQDDISKNIVAALARSLRPEAAPRPQLPPTENLDAYDLYLQGLSVARRAGSQQALGEAIALFERAVAVDPRFALAHARLAESYVRMQYTFDPRKEWEDKGYAEVQRALALDPNLAEAYEARGLLAWTPSQGFQHETAAADLRRALEISPSLADAHHWLGWIYNHVGLLDRALEEARTAARLDPSVHTSRDLQEPLTYLYQHDYQRVLGVYEKDPKTDRPELAHAPALIYVGREKEARSLVDQWLREKRKDAASLLALDALLLAREGEGRKAEEAIARAIPLCEGLGGDHHAQHFIASAYALLGNKREALAWLEKAANNGLPCYPYFEKDPHLASLPGEPDYQAFMKKLKARWEHYRATL